MPSLSQRSEGIEIMDDLNCEGEVVDQTLRELDFINRWLGGNQVTLQPLTKIISPIPIHEPIVIADLGCGSGEMLRLIQQKFKKHQLQLIGIDANPNIIAFARDHTKDLLQSEMKALNVFSNEFAQQKFDVVLATLFLHHFTHEELVKLFKVLKTTTRKAIVVNDLHRHPLAYYSIRWLTRLFSKSTMVKFDAPLSVARGFRKQELIQILREAGIENYQLQWKWAFRWQLVISIEKVG